MPAHPEEFGPYLQVTVTYGVTGWPDQANVINITPYASDPLDATDAANIDTAFANWLDARRGAMCTTVTAKEITVRDKRTEDGPVFVTSHAITGTDASAMLPPGTALVASLHTGIGGRSFRGRIYLGGFGESVNQGDGTIDSASLGSVLTELQALQAALVADGSSIAVVSKFHDGAPRAAAVVSPITSITINNQWDTQRRRGRR